jgi:hypothetical protein
MIVRGSFWLLSVLALSACAYVKHFDERGVPLRSGVYFGPAIFDAPKGTYTQSVKGVGVKLTVSSIFVGYYNHWTAQIDRDCHLNLEIKIQGEGRLLEAEGFGERLAILRELSKACITRSEP